MSLTFINGLGITGSHDEERTLSASVDEKKVDDSLTENNSNEDFPEGGLRAWSVLLGAYVNSFGVYNDFYTRHYLNGYSSSTISWIGSVQLFVALSSGLITGRAFDNGYFYHLIIGGAVLFVFCLFMLSLAQPGQYYQFFLSHGLGVGIATGMSHVPSMGIISHYFHRRRAVAMGVASAGSALGGVLHPIMLNKLFYGSLGFHGSVRASAGMCLGFFVIAIALLRPRLPPTKKSINVVAMLKDFSRDLPYIYMTVGTAIVYTGLYFPIYFIQLNAIKNGIDSNLAFYMVAILNGSNCLGRVFPNMLVHRAGIFNVVITSTFIASLLVFCSLAVKNVAGTIIYSILYGFFAGGFQGLLAPMIASLAKDQTEMGARIGISLTITGIGGLAGTPIAGALLSTTFVWWRPIVFSGICVALGALCFCITRFLIGKAKKTYCL